MNALAGFCKVGIVALLLISTDSASMALCQSKESSKTFQQVDASGKGRFVSIGGVRLQYVDWGGRGESLIFIPGSCDTAFVFGDIAQRLAQDFRVLGLTARGCGASARPETGYDMAHQIGDILGFMDALGIQRCTLIAHSSGGGKITQFAHKYPERVHRLIYLDTVFGYVAPGLEDKIDAQIEKKLGGRAMDSVENWKKSATIWELGAWSAAMERNFEEVISIRPDGKLEERYKTPSAWALEVDRDMQAGLYTDAHIVQSALMIFAMDTDRDRIRQFSKQARRAMEPLVLLTEQHRRDEIRQFQRNGKNVRIVELRHTSHYCFVQHPDRVFHIIRAFLTSPLLQETP